MKKRFSKPSLLIAGLLLLAIPLNYLMEFYSFKAFSEGFNYKANLISYDNFYDTLKHNFSGQILSNTNFYYDIEKRENDILIVNNVFDVRKPSGKPIISVIRKYGIDPKTGKHVAGFGDKDRNGYLFAPSNHDKSDFTYWHINYDVPAHMKFAHEENIEGLKLYVYQCDYKADQTANLKFLPGVPDKRGIELDINLKLWIEPYTGMMIKYEDNTTAWYYDIQTKTRIHPWNKFHNEYEETSISNNIEKTKMAIQALKWRRYYLPFGLFILACGVLSFGWQGSKNRFLRAYLTVGVFLILGLGLSSLATISLYNYYQTSQKTVFYDDCEKIRRSLHQEIQKSIESLQGIKTGFLVNPNISRQQFKQACQYYLNQYKNIRALAWAPVVPHEKRKFIEHLAQTDGYKEYKFYVRQNNSVLPAPDSSEYVPVLYIEPIRGNEGALGYNLASSPSRRKTIQFATSTGEVSATEIITLVQNNSKGNNFLIILPIFEDEVKSSIVHKPLGFLTGVTNMENLVKSLMADNNVPSSFSLTVFDQEQSSLGKKIFSSSNIIHQSKKDFQKSSVVQIANRLWKLQFNSARKISDENNILFFIIPLLGIVLTALLAIYLFRVLTDNSKELETMRNFLLDSQRTGKVGSWRRLLAEDTVSGSEEFYRILGLNVEENTTLSLSRKTFMSRVHPDDRVMVADAIQKAIDTKTDYEIEYRLFRSNGELIDVWVKAHVTYSPNGEPISIQGTMVDVTERKKNEEYLRRYREIVKKTPIGLVVLKLEDTNNIKSLKVVSVNPAALEVTGLKAETVLNQYLVDFSPESYDSGRREAFMNVISTGKTNDLGIIYYPGNAIVSKRFFQSLCFALPNNHIGITLQDVTKKVRTEKELISAKETAEQSKKFIEQFLANMSHEIRTPMNAITGFTSLLLKKNLKDEEKEYIQTIKNSGDNLLRIINDILDLSKIESGMMTFEEHPIHLKQLLSSLNSMFSQKAKEKNLSLEFEYDLSLPKIVQGDSTRLTQILVNLISNSIKFTSKGYVKVLAKVVKKDDKNYHVEFSVRDTGIGIAENKLNLIFERFTQAESHTTRHYGGTGLGLSIVKMLVELLGGKINVTSKIGIGSTFSFTLPFKKTIETLIIDQRETKRINVQELSEKNILLVEDNPINVKFIFALFGNYNIKTDHAENGKIAIEMMGAKTYDIILMDIEMPELDGYETTKIIRKDLKNEVPIIAMTAHVLTGEKDKCLQIGMNDYISKPINEELLLEKMFYHTSIENVKPNEIYTATEKKEKSKFVNLEFLHKSLHGKKDLILEIINTFLEQIPEDLDTINEAINTENYIIIKNRAHKMRSTVSIVEISELETILSEIEDLAKTEKGMDKIKLLNHQLRTICDQALKEMEVEKLNYL